MSQNAAIPVCAACSPEFAPPADTDLSFLHSEFVIYFLPVHTTHTHNTTNPMGGTPIESRLSNPIRLIRVYGLKTT